MSRHLTSGKAVSEVHSQTFIPTSLLLILSLLIFSASAHAQKKQRRAPGGGRAAIVVDERLAALRDAPDLSATLVRRLGRGRMVSVVETRRAGDGLTFHRVAVTRRTRGWLQAEAIVSPARAGDDERLWRLARASENFDRLARTRIFLDTFPRSPLRPAALLIFGEEAESAASRLSREAARRLDEREMQAGGASLKSYYLSYNGLDRFRKQGIVFTFDAATKQFHYDGAAWREILRRYPRSTEAVEARKHLEALTSRLKINFQPE